MLEFGYSPCPNDTFMFWAWAHSLLSSELAIQPQFHDIQQLNSLALSENPIALTKISMATYLEPAVQKHYNLLSKGAALGRGCGPLLVSRQPWSFENPTPLKIAIPGRNTTAFKLVQMALGPWVEEWVELRYDEIMPTVLKSQDLDAGLIIHESRFIYQEIGLVCAFDLGAWWEEKTGLPLPLGVMVAHKSIPEDTIREVESNLQQSITKAQDTLHLAKDSPESKSLWDYLRIHATELDDQTILSHIELYVNEYSCELGREGHAAIAEFEARARRGTQHSNAVL